MNCTMCPRKCGADRESALGFCRAPQGFKIARAALHFWEEPCISGKNGSGAVFFSGCNLKCIYCQNHTISHGGFGRQVSDERLVQIFDSLVSQGAHNLNLVTPTHYSDRLSRVLADYKSAVPVIYNSSGYDGVRQIKSVNGLADIYLPDFKYISPEKSLEYSGARDYFRVCSAAIEQMRLQAPRDVFDENGMLQSGVIIRHLVLPMNTNSSVKILKHLHSVFGSDIMLSLMRQYTPSFKAKEHEQLCRRVTDREYDKVLDCAMSLGFKNVFIQSASASDEGFIPAFDLTGV